MSLCLGMEISFDIKKYAVYDEVQKITSYIGAKKKEEKEDAYLRMAATDSDVDLLEQFWREACVNVIDELKPFILEVNYPENSQTIVVADVFSIKLQVSDDFDQKLAPALGRVLEEFFINKICSEWMFVTGDKEADYHKKLTEENGKELRRIIYYRNRPLRQ